MVCRSFGLNLEETWGESWDIRKTGGNMYREMPGRYTGRVMAIGRGFGRYSTY
jgi:hypothetical protein